MCSEADYLSLDQQFIRKLNETILGNLGNEHFGVEELSREMGLSRSAFLRKLKRIIHKSGSQYIREKRLLLEMEMLRNNVAPVSEIAYRVGFSSPAYFNTCFHEYFGFPPGEVKKRESGLQPDEEDQPAKISQKNQENDKNLFRRRILLISSLILVLLAVTSWFFYPRYSPTIQSGISGIIDKSKTIAVLPFKSLDTDPKNQVIAGGVTEDIYYRLE